MSWKIGMVWNLVFEVISIGYKFYTNTEITIRLQLQ